MPAETGSRIDVDQIVKEILAKNGLKDSEPKKTTAELLAVAVPRALIDTNVSPSTMMR